MSKIKLVGETDEKEVKPIDKVQQVIEQETKNLEKEGKSDNSWIWWLLLALVAGYILVMLKNKEKEG
jgi:hypothetical protein